MRFRLRLAVIALGRSLDSAARNPCIAWQAFAPKHRSLPDFDSGRFLFFGGRLAMRLDLLRLQRCDPQGVFSTLNQLAVMLSAAFEVMPAALDRI